jgi:Protein of unknown function (DUF3455)
MVRSYRKFDGGSRMVPRKEDDGMKSLKRTNTVQAMAVLLFNIGVVAMALFLFAGNSRAQTNPSNGRPVPDLSDCPRLHVEVGNKLAFHVYAEGVQIYRWDGTSWTFVGPEAMLFADAGFDGVVGLHYAGPTWESNSGSKVVGAVNERCTPDPEAIPWLLLRRVSSQGPGIFERVTFIQRLNTAGGLAPTDPGVSVGETARVPYTAEYFFYRKH